MHAGDYLDDQPSGTLPYGLAILLFWTGLQLINAADPPVPPGNPSPVIASVSFDWKKKVTAAPGSDNWPVTWAKDGNLYTSWGDGGGFGGTNSLDRVSLGVARIEGDWQNHRGVNVWGGHRPEEGRQATFKGKSYGILSVEGVLYMWVGLAQPAKDPFDKVRIATSTDQGRSWKLAGWSFTKEDGVMLPTFLNFGRDYEGARDGYVYSYLIRYRSEEGPDDYEDKVPWLQCQRPGTVDLARVEKSRILDRGSWEFFAGFGEKLEPQWTTILDQRDPVFEDRNGVGWNVSVSYNAPLQRYLLTTEHTETHRGNIGIHDAPEPWGPWTTVLYENEWGKGQIPANTFYWNFVNKWLSPDGKEFSLVFTGRKENDSWNVIRGHFTTR